MAQLHFFPITVAQRKNLHSIFNDWLSQASDEGFEQFLAVRHELAPAQVCSFVRLVQGCSVRQDLAQRLPGDLKQRLQVHRWLRFGATVVAA
ncbi:hypothetical protein [Alcaligenes sp. Me129]|uniref:hypothetical protein n=1 Tax=Alcaligenes sp. Me129 TaxID=3392635 RepID=UPI003D229598